MYQEQGGNEMNNATMKGMREMAEAVCEKDREYVLLDDGRVVLFNINYERAEASKRFYKKPFIMKYEDYKTYHMKQA